MKKLNAFLTATMICLSLTLTGFAQRRATPINLNVTIDDISKPDSRNSVGRTFSGNLL
jgi:hypothetical protein